MRLPRSFARAIVGHSQPAAHPAFGANALTGLGHATTLAPPVALGALPRRRLSSPAIASVEFAASTERATSTPVSEEETALLTLLNLALGCHPSDCQPAVRLRSHVELAERADEHAYVLSLLPPEIRMQLVSTGAVGQHQLLMTSGLKKHEWAKVPPEATPGVTLLTRGSEAVSRHRGFAS